MWCLCDGEGRAPELPLQDKIFQLQRSLVAISKTVLKQSPVSAKKKKRYLEANQKVVERLKQRQKVIEKNQMVEE